MARALHRWLWKSAPELHISLVCRDRPTLTGPRLSWFYDGIWWPKFLHRVRNGLSSNEHQYLFLGGGAILRSSTGIDWKSDILRSFKKKSHNKALGISLSVGPFKDAGAESRCAQAISFLDKALVRDVYSLNFFKQHAPTVPVRLCYDIAALESLEGATEFPVGLVLMEPKTIDEKKWLDDMMGALRKKFSTLNFFVFCAHEEMKPSGYLRFLQKPGDTVHVYDGDIDAFLKKLANCGAIVAGRFHGAVLARAMGKPFISCPPTETAHKHVEFMKSFPCDNFAGVWEVGAGHVSEAVAALEHRLTLNVGGDRLELQQEIRQNLAWLMA